MMHILAGPPPLPGFLNALAGPLGHYGYWLILALVVLEDFGVPVPGETVLIAAAIFAGHQQLNVVAVGVIAFAAAVIGDNIGFVIGHFGGRAVALRWGRYVFLTEERLDKAAAFFDRHGGKIIVVARFIEGLRQANGIIAGISGMHWRRFVVFNALDAALWVGTWVSLGYLAGNHIGTIYHYITQYSYYVLIAALVLLAAYVTRRVMRRRSRPARKAASEPGGNAAHQKVPATRKDAATHKPLAVQESSAADGAQEAPWVRQAAGDVRVGEHAEDLIEQPGTIRLGPERTPGSRPCSCWSTRAKARRSPRSRPGSRSGRPRPGDTSNETVELLAARAPKLGKATRDAREAGHAYVVLDGTLIHIDRVAADRPFYSGKHQKHGMNLQVIASPDGDILWVSGALPGSVHDKKAEWIWGVLDELDAAGLITLADKGYQGSAYAKIPYRGKNKPESQKEANRAHARLRSPGERANAQLKTWRILRKLRCCPWRAGQLAKAIHVLQIREANSG